MKGDEGLTVELRLRGNPSELESAVGKFSSELGIEVLSWRPDGGWPVPLADIAGKDLLRTYAKIGTPMKRIEGIRGGDIAPHFHFGDEVFLLERDEFRGLIGDVAKKLAFEFADRVDYDRTVDLMSQIAIDTVPLPDRPVR